MANSKRFINSELERDVLRAILFNPEAIFSITSMSNDKTFFADERWSIVWQAMLHLTEKGKAIDTALIRSVMQSEGYRTSLQATETLDELLMAHESAKHIDSWVQELWSYYQRRELVALTGRIEGGLNQSEDNQEILEDVARRLTQLNGQKERKTLADSARSLNDELIHHYSKGTFRRGLMTPFSRLNRITNGLGDGWMIVIGADSGVGKTTMALQMADTVVENTDNRVAIITLEMDPGELTERLLSSRTMIHADRIKKADLTAEEMKLIDEASTDLANSGDQLVMITPASFIGSPTATKIAAMIQVEHARSPLGLVIIDYFQIFATGNVSDKEEACRIITMVAKQLNIPVILLSQLTRTFRHENRAPEVYDLRGTSQLQNDPDLIVLLDNPSKRTPAERWAMNNIIEGLTDVYVGKFRHGPMGHFQLHFKGENYLFQEIDTNAQSFSFVNSPTAQQVEASPSDILLGHI